MTPPCYNRPPRAAGTWEPTGRTQLRPGQHDIPGDPLEFAGAMIYKPVLRWRPSAFEDKCATWDGRGIGPNGEPYPQAHGWDCNGCRWLPPHLSTAEQAAPTSEDAGTFWSGQVAFAEAFAARVAAIELMCESYRAAMSLVKRPRLFLGEQFDLGTPRFDAERFGVVAIDRQEAPEPPCLVPASACVGVAPRLAWREDITTCQHTLNELEMIEARRQGARYAAWLCQVDCPETPEPTGARIRRIFARLIPRWYT